MSTSVAGRVGGALYPTVLEDVTAGGINNEARQLGSITILNELLNLLSSAVKRPLRLTTGSID